MDNNGLVAEITELKRRLSDLEVARVQRSQFLPKSVQGKVLEEGTVTDTELADDSVVLDKIGAGVFLDEDDMVSNSATAGATQQSIKAYADTKLSSVPTKTRSIWIPATAMITTVGTPALADTDDTGPYWALDDASSEGVGTTIRIPQDIASGVFTAYVVWASLTSNSGNIRWNYRYSQPIGESGDVLTATDSTSFTEAAVAGASDLNISVGTALNGTYTAARVMGISVRRLGADAADTLTGDVGFLGLALDYTSIQ